MSQRRDIEARLELYDDLSGIIGAMRSFALAELHKVTRKEEAQHTVMDTLQQAMRDVSTALPAQAQQGGDVWLLLGSVRGFCGNYNEEVLHAWQSEAAAGMPTIVVGERLAGMMPQGAAVFPVAGAMGALDAPEVIDRILVALQQARRSGGAGAGLVVCLRDEERIYLQCLLPYPVPAGGENNLPLTNEAPLQVAAGVAEHYLFHSLLGLLLRAVRVENRMRLMQMENALQHLNQGSDELKLKRNRLRQEEIVEEIELMARDR